MAINKPTLSQIISFRKVLNLPWLMWRGQLSVKLAPNRGTSTLRTIFVALLRAGALYYVQRMKRSISTPNPASYGLLPQGKRLIDSCGKRGEPAVVYPASEVGS